MPLYRQPTDRAAVHVNVANEISLIAEKLSTNDGDLLIIEDSTDGGAKKKLTVQTALAGTVPNSSTVPGGITIKTKDDPVSSEPLKLDVGAAPTQGDIEIGLDGGLQIVIGKSDYSGTTIINGSLAQGQDCTAGSPCASAMGVSCEADEPGSHAVGIAACSWQEGVSAWASGCWSSAGDAQGFHAVLRGRTTAASRGELVELLMGQDGTKRLYLPGRSSCTLILEATANNGAACWSFRQMVCVRQTIGPLFRSIFVIEAIGQKEIVATEGSVAQSWDMDVVSVPFPTHQTRFGLFFNSGDSQEVITVVCNIRVVGTSL